MPRHRARSPSVCVLGKIGARDAGVLGDEHGRGIGLRFKWLVSTCVAALVGAVGIGTVMIGSMDKNKDADITTVIQTAATQAFKPYETAPLAPQKLIFSSQKTDRLQTASGGLSTKHIIHDSLTQKRGQRDFISIKPYARIVARLPTAPAPGTMRIPPFNPFKLYANLSPIAARGTNRTSSTSDNVAVEVVELVGGILPSDDGQELNTAEVTALVSEVQESISDVRAVKASLTVGGEDSSLPDFNEQELQTKQPSGWTNSVKSSPVSEPLPPNTTVLEKSVFEEDGDGVEEGQEVRSVIVKPGDVLIGLTRRVGAESWQGRAIVEAARKLFPPEKLLPGQNVRFTLVPSPTRSGQMEPIRVSIFAPGQRHLVTVFRDEAGEYVASSTPIDSGLTARLKPNRRSTRATLYSGIYQAARLQNLDGEQTMRLLKVHAFDTDFKKRVTPGDQIELFYDLKNAGNGIDAKPRELLFTSVTIGGKKRDFYRYRTSDGHVDFYDRNGNSAKKFLMRKPVKGSAVRFTSGFGFRFHPILKRRKMHTGADWAAPRGTPILAAGNGTIEQAGRKGGYGNYVRIRHANGYQTTYAHMRRISPGVVPGVRVRQGQVIGQVGSTGLSSGPHLHYEVLVNTRPVNPMSIAVPRGRKLKGKALGKFQKARRQIDELRLRAPVTTRVAQIGQG